MVVANWEIEIGESSFAGQMEVVEVATDQMGRFVVPSWGPRFLFNLGHIDGPQPTVWIFRPDYMPIVAVNQANAFGQTSSLIRMQLGEVKLMPAAGRDADYARAIDEVMDQVSAAFLHGKCNWHRIPKFRNALQDAQLHLQVDGRGGTRLLGPAAFRETPCV